MGDILPSDEESLSFSDYLTESALKKIKILEEKCQKSQLEVVKLKEFHRQKSQQINELNKKLVENEKYIKKLEKIISDQKNAAVKKEKIHKENLDDLGLKMKHSHEINRKNSELQVSIRNVTKEKVNAEKDNKELKIRLANAQKKIENQNKNSIESEEKLRKVMSETKEKQSNLSRDMLTLVSIVKKQDEVIAVLQKEKVSILGAKFIKNVEQELKSAIESLTLKEK